MFLGKCCAFIRTIRRRILSGGGPYIRINITRDVHSPATKERRCDTRERQRRRVGRSTGGTPLRVLVEIGLLKDGGTVLSHDSSD
jgi:hypothetical protein